MLIGEAARRVGVSVQAVRLYEEKGLFHPSSRTKKGYRQYSEDDVHILGAIKAAKRM